MLTGIRLILWSLILSAPIVATSLVLMSSLSLTPLDSGTSYPELLRDSGSIRPNICLAWTIPCVLKCLVPTSGGC
eukprot:2474991-Amphidinium_carterae.1